MSVSNNNPRKPNSQGSALLTVRSNNQWLLSFAVATLVDPEIGFGDPLMNRKDKSQPAAMGCDPDLSSVSSIFDFEVKSQYKNFGNVPNKLTHHLDTFDLNIIG